jgi:hypothetical protein
VDADLRLGLEAAREGREALHEPEYPMFC